MPNFEKMITFLAVILINMCENTSAFSDFMNLLKTVEGERMECIEELTKSGLYTFKSDPRIPDTECVFSIIVPTGNVAFVKPTERTCETTSSPFILSICDHPSQEGQFSEGEHLFLYDATESVTIHVDIKPIIKLGCNEWAKNLPDLINSVVMIENDEPTKLCMIQLPPALNIQFLKYESGGKKKLCCPDVFTVSADMQENGIVYNDPINTCELNSKQPTVSTRCEKTFVYFRNAGKQDKVYFKLEARHKEHIENCVKEETEPRDPTPFVCLKKSKNKIRSKHPF